MIRGRKRGIDDGDDEGNDSFKGRGLEFEGRREREGEEKEVILHSHVVSCSLVSLS